MIKLVLLRHGESIFNRGHEFTGWTDIELTKKGIKNAEQAADLLKAHGFLFDIAYTSFLKRSIKTLWIVLERMDLMWIPVFKNWRLNERHYGALQELDKKEMAKQLGKEQVHTWRRSFSVVPPSLDEDDERHPSHDPKYENIDGTLPSTESLEKCIKRVLPYWNKKIVPQLKSGKRILIVAHGNSLRALVKHLDKISNSKISKLTIPTGVPLVYELDKNLKPKRHYYLGNQTEIKKMIEKDKSQSKK